MADVNPLVYIFKLVGAIVCLIFTPIILVQMYIFYYSRLLVQLVIKHSVFLDKFLVFM